MEYCSLVTGNKLQQGWISNIRLSEKIQTEKGYILSDAVYMKFKKRENQPTVTAGQRLPGARGQRVDWLRRAMRGFLGWRHVSHLSYHRDRVDASICRNASKGTRKISVLLYISFNKGAFFKKTAMQSFPTRVTQGFWHTGPSAWSPLGWGGGLVGPPVLTSVYRMHTVTVSGCYDINVRKCCPKTWLKHGLECAPTPARW